MTGPEPPDVPEVHRAYGELIVFALASRDDWTESAVIWALNAAYEAGMAWEKAAPELARLAMDPTTSPRDLVPSEHSPLVKHEGRPPNADFLAARAAVEAAAAAQRARVARAAAESA